MVGELSPREGTSLGSPALVVSCTCWMDVLVSPLPQSCSLYFFSCSVPLEADPSSASPLSLSCSKSRASGQFLSTASFLKVVTCMKMTIQIPTSGKDGLPLLQSKSFCVAQGHACPSQAKSILMSPTPRDRTR